jgi:hypothetical protein
MNWQLPATDSRLIRPVSLGNWRDRRLRGFGSFAVLMFIAITCPALGRTGTSRTGQSAETATIVRRLVERNQDRAERLGTCTSKRSYHIEYHGFSRTMVADMNVDVLDQGSTSRTFHITTQSGSHVLLDHVLKKLLESEQTAAQNRNETGLTPDNYKFSLIGNTNEDGRQLFILQVEPKVNRKLLYRGKIWVDAEDYAVVRVEAQPAENPSFWIRSTQIHHVYTKISEFWLPQHNVSQSKIRFGGSATLTIDYSDYRFQRPVMPSVQALPVASPVASERPAVE